MEEDLIQISSRLKSSNQESSALSNTTKSQKPGVYIKTFGCQMNQYDSDKILKIVSDRYAPVEDPTQAKLIIVNTCSVRDKAEKKLYSLLGQLKEIKDEKEGVLIGVGGCVAQQEGEQILKRSKAVDFVFGTHNLSLVPNLIDRRLEGFGRQAAVNYRDEWEDIPAEFVESKSSVFVSISRGCNKNCTYCIVPTTRGKEVSRAMSEILKETRIAAHRGAREITLLGQTVNSYGLDLNPKISFVQLLDEISKIDGIERIRFISPHPQEIRADFVDLVCSNPKIAHHVHMPLQSGSDRILKAMNRNYRRKRYLQIIEQIRSRVPDMAITTDVIIGFPGETEQDFQETMEILNSVRFDHSYSFVFSPRPGTVAATLTDDTPTSEKLDRLYRYQTRQNEIAAEVRNSWLHKEVEVLIDGPSSADPQIMSGRSSQNIGVNLDKHYPDIKPGSLVKVRIEDTGRYNLKGTIVSSA